MSTEYLTGVKYIELTQGKVAIVDDWVAPLVNQYKWHYGFNGRSVGYAKRWRRKGEGKGSKLIRMHNVIWESVNGEIPDGLFVDHIYGSTLDNRLRNLRLVNKRLNSINSGRRRKGLLSSEYPGVSWDKSRSMWIVRLRCGETHSNVGRFLLEEDAAIAYWKAVEDWEERGIKPNTKRRNL